MRSLGAATSLVLVSTLSVTVPDAGAEPFAILPDGSLVFNAAFTTHGVFTCGPVPCTGSGTNAVTIGSGAQTTTITFTGANTMQQVGNVAIPVSLGTFHAMPSDPAFRFPAHVNPNVAVLRLDLTMTHSSPVPSTVPVTWFFGPGGGPDLPFLLGGTWLAAPTGPNPPGFNYGPIVYTILPFSIPGIGLTDLTADAGVVPEPGTMLLVGTGLATAALARRRRSRRARQ